MPRIIVIGCPGAGKSTFARKLQNKSRLPLYYLDMLWHKPDRTTISTEEFDAKLEEYRGKKHIIVFRSRKEADEYLETWTMPAESR